MKTLAAAFLVALPACPLLFGAPGGDSSPIAEKRDSATTESEVPEFKITPKQTQYRDFGFQVLFEEQKLMHDQWKICWVVVSISPGKRKVLDKEGYMEVWDRKHFIYSSSLPQTTVDMVPDSLKKEIKGKTPFLFLFSINPEFAGESWFNYQVLRDDGSGEMNCKIGLREFLKLPTRR
jgi:hypothetical protein